MPSAVPQVLKDVPYIPGDAPNEHRLDLHIPPGSHGKPLVVFVHGGAWRKEDKADWTSLGRALAQSTGCVCAIPNYRLSPMQIPESGDHLRHPEHAQDVLTALEFLLDWDGGSPNTAGAYDSSRLYVLGHSCGAHIIASIFLEAPAPVVELLPSPSLLSAARGIVVSEGIFDIDVLLQSFPGYRQWFIELVFGDRPSYAEVSPTSAALRKKDLRWLVLHSKGDTLVDQRQPEAMYNHLVSLYSAEGADAGKFVEKEWQLTEEHNDVLKGNAYIAAVTQFVRIEIGD